MTVSMVTLGTEQMDKMEGMEISTSGSKQGPSPVTRAATHSTAVVKRSEAAVAIDRTDGRG